MRLEEPNFWHSCWIWTASSRVGASTSTMGPSPDSAHGVIHVVGRAHQHSDAASAVSISTFSKAWQRVQSPHVVKARMSEEASYAMNA